ncbi:hypothetical protein TorRG33x02_329540 [Trema orientale]|uniref:Transmembrane protein n=1 Tax=Trema orientale TaxID=63057 RepID=A0A2P5B8J1_TREOI|nr:hypothetical protein TorRG33x02_329540 [Trema orientale]
MRMLLYNSFRFSSWNSITVNLWFDGGFGTSFLIDVVVITSICSTVFSDFQAVFCGTGGHGDMKCFTDSILYSLLLLLVLQFIMLSAVAVSPSVSFCICL